MLSSHKSGDLTGNQESGILLCFTSVHKYQYRYLDHVAHQQVNDKTSISISRVMHSIISGIGVRFGLMTARLLDHHQTK